MKILTLYKTKDNSKKKYKNNNSYVEIIKFMNIILFYVYVC